MKLVASPRKWQLQVIESFLTDGWRDGAEKAIAEYYRNKILIKRTVSKHYYPGNRVGIS
jgi:hypothetical protein